jgi:hypothetical protein
MRERERASESERESEKKASSATRCQLGSKRMQPPSPSPFFPRAVTTLQLSRRVPSKAARREKKGQHAIFNGGKKRKRRKDRASATTPLPALQKEHTTHSLASALLSLRGNKNKNKETHGGQRRRRGGTSWREECGEKERREAGA